jgi:hypothetical protein
MSKFFTQGQLRKANEIAIDRGYNRQLSEAAFSVGHGEYPVILAVLHEHAAGRPVAPHVRCIIKVAGLTAAIDCDMDLFESLSESEEAT